MKIEVIVCAGNIEGISGARRSKEKTRNSDSIPFQSRTGAINAITALA